MVVGGASHRATMVALHSITATTVEAGMALGGARLLLQRPVRQEEKEEPPAHTQPQQGDK